MKRSGLLQDINFYRAPRQHLLDRVLELRVLAALVAVLIVTVLPARFWNAQQLREGERELIAATAARNELQARLEALQAERGKIPGRSGDAADLQALQALSVRLKEIRQHYHGFSARCNALARAHVPGIWLTRIYLENGSDPLLLLAGKTTDANLLPRYVAALGRDESLRASSLYSLSMAQDETGSMGFGLSNRPQSLAVTGERR
jgi:hypothetical protein